MDRRLFLLLAAAGMATSGWVAPLAGCSVLNRPDDPLAPFAGGAGGTGGAGGGCVAELCPGEDTTCRYRSCADGSCGFEDAPAGTPCHDNGGSACDGSGQCVAQMANGESCTSGTECASGFCVDEVCCESACDGPCTACNLVPNVGTCSPYAAGDDPETDCPTDQPCDGAGHCTKALGESCEQDSECASDHCPDQDGVCCDVACDQTCEACTASKTDGADGTCAPIPAGTDPDDECSGACGGGNACACPDNDGSSSIGGPLVQYGFCWYVAAPGGTCDQACGDIGGSNLAVQAQDAWANACSAVSGADISTAFRNAGNPASWTTAGTNTSCHSLGYGYTNQSYYGKCTTGTATICGAYPGETNDSTTRTPVCACFSAP